MERMDLREKSRDHLNYEASAEWQFHNQSIGLVPADPSGNDGNPMDSSSGLWNHPTNPQNQLGFCEGNVQTSASSSNSITIGMPVAVPSRLDMGGVFLPPGLGVLPPSLSHFPTDSAFIERAARFSCFNGGNFSTGVNPFSTPEPLSPYSNASKGSPGAQIQKSEMNRGDALSGASMPTDHVSNGESPMKDQRRHGVGVSTNDSGGRDPEFGGIGQEGTPNSGNAAGHSSSGGKKRKRPGQHMEFEPAERTRQLSTEVAKENVNGKQKDEQNNSTMAIVKPSGKQPADSLEAPKDDCIHMRARRGQATNSHSLAERVRREKISERMKYLQDLVPGCSKVTGKAVMLDEIINYVQSLQRQVEFLSMKLANVNPRLDFNIEGLLSKDFLQPRAGPSSTMGFSHDMIHPQLHLPLQGLVPAGMSEITHPSDALRRALNAQLIMTNGYKDPTAQMPSAWDDALHNAIQMNFGTANPPLDTQDLSSKPRNGFSI